METTRTIPTITTDAALGIVRKVFDLGREKDLRFSVVVVDPSMRVVAFARDDGATPHSAETSKRKAQTAASTGKPTGWMPDDLAITLPLGTGNLLTNIPGGVPLLYDGVVVGGVGVAGGTVEEDAEIAEMATNLFRS